MVHLFDRPQPRAPHRRPFLLRLIGGLLKLAGFCALVLFGLCFTPYPWQACRWLATDPVRLSVPPNYIVVLGGGGIPSETGLMRCYAAAAQARLYADARIIVALPVDGDYAGSSAEKMKDELVLRGVAAERIAHETEGRNTREQAVKTAALIVPDPAATPVLLVTSPVHLKRALLSFRKTGFGNIEGAARFGESIEADMTYDARDLDADRPAPGVGQSLFLRYQFWTNLMYELRAAHEGCALAYYWWMGWI